MALVPQTLRIPVVINSSLIFPFHIFQQSLMPCTANLCIFQKIRNFKKSNRKINMSIMFMNKGGINVHSQYCASPVHVGIKCYSNLYNNTEDHSKERKEKISTYLFLSLIST